MPTFDKGYQFRASKRTEAGLKRRLDALEGKLLCLKNEWALLCRERGELDAKVVKLGEALGSLLKPLTQRSVNDVAEMVPVFNVQLAEGFKLLELDLCLQSAKSRMG